MSDCWQIPSILPTTDASIIKRAYREQVKLYHPDTVASPEKKRRYTIICPDINAAYRKALSWAEGVAGFDSARLLW